MYSIGLLLVAFGLGLFVLALVREIVRRRTDQRKETGKRSIIALISTILGKIPAYVAPNLIVRYRAVFVRQAAFAGFDELVWTAETMAGAYLLGMLVAATAAFQIFAGWSPPTRILVGLGIGVIYVKVRIQGCIEKRQHAINKGFPYVLDLLHLCVNSGQGINTAIQQISDVIGQGPIREEFSRVINAVRHGSNLSEAFRRMNERVKSSEIRAVLLALTQAIERGAQVGDTLGLQAEQLRFSRLMAVEEQVQKLPTKMTLPVILFFMPCMLIVIIGPIIISTVLSFRAG